ncbi:hypothetical protein Ahy_A08g037810 isoform C [Arachis hypogaea]|uniref:Uncharacterized protein n=1 Tax=Arachis hypogaea TaxID=3818 RepID=A0A445BRV8_ARAHY|nr:hypothetical protein Ahy_A08g037810 isoform C [Arachis hypogaea]
MIRENGNNENILAVNRGMTHTIQGVGIEDSDLKSQRPTPLYLKECTAFNVPIACSIETPLISRYLLQSFAYSYLPSHIVSSLSGIFYGN